MRVTWRRSGRRRPSITAASASSTIAARRTSASGGCSSAWSRPIHDCASRWKFANVLQQAVVLLVGIGEPGNPAGTRSVEDEDRVVAGVLELLGRRQRVGHAARALRRIGVGEKHDGGFGMRFPPWWSMRCRDLRIGIDDPRRRDRSPRRQALASRTESESLEPRLSRVRPLQFLLDHRFARDRSGPMTEGRSGSALASCSPWRLPGLAPSPPSGLADGVLDCLRREARPGATRHERPPVRRHRVAGMSSPPEEPSWPPAVGAATPPVAALAEVKP